MEQDMELRSPPSPTAYNCFSKKDRIQERQREEEQQVPKENDVRRLEEMVKQQEMEIARFHKRQERLKQKLEKTKAQLARKEQKTLKILQRYKHLKRERLALKEKEREEDKVTSKKTVDMIDTVNVREEKEMDSKREQQQEKEEERKRAREKYMERKEQRRAERRKKFPQKETSFGPEKRDQPPASTESKAEDLTSETPSQVQTDGPTSGEAAEENPAWGGHDGGEAVIIEVESQQRLRSRSSARYIQAEVEDEHEDVSQARQLIPLGAPAGVLTVNLKTCRDFSKSAPLKKGSRAAVRITIGRTVKYTVQQPYSDPLCFDEWKHFSLQIQKEDICGVQQSSLVVVELIMVDPDLTTPILIGRDTIMLREILKKSSLSHQFNLRLMQKKVCKLDADLAFSYGSMGYGYSHQIKQAGRTAESLVEKSLFPRCPPNEDRDPLCNVITPSARTRLDFIPSGTECRISAGLKDCIQKRGRLLHLHQAPAVPAETPPLRTCLKRRDKTNEEDADNRTTEGRTRGTTATCKKRKQRAPAVEPAAPSSSGRRMLQRVLSTVRSLVECRRSRSSARYIQAEVEDEHEEVSQTPPLKKGSRAAVRITIGRTVKYTVQQPYSDPMCFDEWKHFSLQIQKEDICGVQQSSLVVVELSL
ncbi:hypothetical protein SRHO_G00287960 [Serrasalmus rhombeus]